MMQNGHTAPLSRVRHAVKRALLSSGYYGRRLARLQFPGVAVLCYHSVRHDNSEALPFHELHVTTSTFERHCQLIAALCHPISPAVVFGCSGPIVRGTHFWFDSVYQSAGEHAVLEARSAPVAEWTEFVTVNQLPASPSDRHRPLTVDELKRLAGNPLIEIGGHTLSHPTLALMSYAEQAREVEGCRTALEQLVGAPIGAFAYPYGVSTHDYSADTVSVVRGAGFDLGFTTKPGFAALDCPAYEIPRFVMLDSVDEVELAHRLSYSWHI